MKKILSILFIFLIVFSSSYLMAAQGNKSNMLTLERRFIGFAFLGSEYTVSQLRFYYSASSASSTSSVPNSNNASKLKLTHGKIKFRGKYYTLNFMLTTARRIEADVVVPTNEALTMPIGHLSLRVIGGILIVGQMKIYPGNKENKDGNGEYNIYFRHEPGPNIWTDLDQDKDKDNWLK